MSQFPTRPSVVTDLGLLVQAGWQYPVIYADPPWRYRDAATRGAAERHYPTMSIQELCELPVKELACANAQLHLWTTNSFLREAFDLMDAWGFTYKTNLIWVKPQIGLGHYWRNAHEILLLGVRGRAPFLDASVRSWHLHSRLTHSEKPELFRGLIEQVASGPYLELFGRRHPGSSHWTVFGNDVAGAQTPRDEESLRTHAP